MQTGLKRPLHFLDDLARAQPFDLGATIPEIFDLLPLGVQVDDANHRTLYVNACFTQMLGYSLEDIADLEDWFRLAYPDLAERAAMRQDWSARLHTAAADGQDIPPIERRLTCKNGQKKVVEFYIRRVGTYYIYLNSDITARADLAEEMRRLAFTDSLTGQGNRRSFFAAGEALLAAGTAPLAGLMVDIDHFKTLNDRFGHHIGDEALVQIAQRCRTILAEDQHLARLGGEEFGVLLPGFEAGAARTLSEELRLAVTERPLAFPSLGLEVPIGVSVGGAMVAADEHGIDGLLRRADRALYAAKRGGRNRVCFDEA